jgi:hypothetical protein
MIAHVTITTTSFPLGLLAFGPPSDRFPELDDLSWSAAYNDRFRGIEPP